MSTEQITHLMDNSEFDTWADIYAEARIADLIHIPLSTFLLDPWAYLVSAGQDTALDCVMNGHKPLLPEQVKASSRIHSQWAAEDASIAQAKRSHLSLVVNR